MFKAVHKSFVGLKLKAQEKNSTQKTQGKKHNPNPGIESKTAFLTASFQKNGERLEPFKSKANAKHEEKGSVYTDPRSLSATSALGTPTPFHQSVVDGLQFANSTDISSAQVIHMQNNIVNAQQQGDHRDSVHGVPRHRLLSGAFHQSVVDQSQPVNSTDIPASAEAHMQNHDIRNQLHIGDDNDDTGILGPSNAADEQDMRDLLPLVRDKGYASFRFLSGKKSRHERVSQSNDDGEYSSKNSSMRRGTGFLKPPLPASRLVQLFRTCFETYPLSIDPSDSISSDPIDLTDYINRGTWVASGGFGHVYKGSWKENILWDITGLKVPQYIAVKVINLPALDEEDKKNKRLKNIKREVQIWSKIDHDNILPLVGIARIDGDSNLPAFVSPWMQNGSVTNFLEKNPSFRAVNFLPQIIKGLHYLHTLTPEIVHGDIKAANVLVNCRGEACLCDFGLSRFVIDNTLWRTTATHANGTVRWMSPELLDGDQVIPTKASDIYAYGMTCYEILCGRIPFESVGSDFAVMTRVLKGTRPEKPQSTVCSDEIWAVITSCWNQDPKNRPSAERVLALMTHEDNVRIDCLFQDH